MLIDASKYDFAQLNRVVRASGEDCEIVNCLGHRFIADGIGGISIKIKGIPGNALGAYLNGADIEVFANAQDAVGDTMNDGRIVVHGSIGDAAGYAMRGGKIFVRKGSGYRAGIHMKAYRDKIPVLIIGGKAGSFLGEYQAGGDIIVLGLDCSERDVGRPPVGNFPCTGMRGGRMFIRGEAKGIKFPSQVSVREASDEDMRSIEGHIDEFCSVFGLDAAEIKNSPFTIITPDTHNPYKQMYVQN